VCPFVSGPTLVALRRRPETYETAALPLSYVGLSVSIGAAHEHRLFPLTGTTIDRSGICRTAHEQLITVRTRRRGDSRSRERSYDSRAPPTGPMPESKPKIFVPYAKRNAQFREIELRPLARLVASALPARLPFVAGDPPLPFACIPRQRESAETRRSRPNSHHPLSSNPRGPLGLRSREAVR